MYFIVNIVAAVIFLNNEFVLSSSVGYFYLSFDYYAVSVVEEFASPLNNLFISFIMSTKRFMH